MIGVLSITLLRYSISCPRLAGSRFTESLALCVIVMIESSNVLAPPFHLDSFTGLNPLPALSNKKKR